MTETIIKGYEEGRIVQFVVAELDGTVLFNCDTYEEAERCAEEGQQIVELDGYGYVADITDASDEGDHVEKTEDEQPSPYTVHDFASANSLSPRSPWTR